jgi:hypothetical protein
VPDRRETVSEEWIDAALDADAEWMRISRSVVFVSPARDQVRMMLEAAEPLIRAAERERIAALADKVEAIYDEDGDGVPEPFADMIREQS